MNVTLIGLSTVAAMFFGMLLCIEVGRRIGMARLASHPDGLAAGAGAVEAAVFGLMGLLVAFTFSGGASRFEERRHLISEEANAIGTAYLRIDLLPEADQPPLRKLFREYLDSRLDTYAKLPDIAAARAEYVRSTKLQGEIWAYAVRASREAASQPAHMLLLPALNQMIDITTTRMTATENHPPLIIYLFLSLLSLIGSTLAGYSMSVSKDRSWLHMLAFAAMFSIAVYVIIDIEFPRLGLIRIDASDHMLVDVRKSMQ